MKIIKRISTFKNFVGETTVIYKRTDLPKVYFKDADTVYEYIKDLYEDCMGDHEEVKVIQLDQRNGLINVHNVSSGAETSCLIPINMILTNALVTKTMKIILVHNHPSGNLKPSEADKKITHKLKKACEFLELLDALIVTRESYNSYLEEC